ncbi:hypothetical protein ABT124_27975 [Streptomyces sp. NPDC001982]
MAPASVGARIAARPAAYDLDQRELAITSERGLLGETKSSGLDQSDD